nr:MAG TPA: hypothetical protein [Caudoviricetes sp.]
MILTPSFSSTKLSIYSRRIVVKVNGFKCSARLSASIY